MASAASEDSHAIQKLEAQWKELHASIQRVLGRIISTVESVGIHDPKVERLANKQAELQTQLDAVGKALGTHQPEGAGNRGDIQEMPTGVFTCPTCAASVLIDDLANKTHTCDNGGSGGPDVGLLVFRVVCGRAVPTTRTHAFVRVRLALVSADGTVGKEVSTTVARGPSPTWSFYRGMRSESATALRVSVFAVAVKLKHEVCLGRAVVPLEEVAPGTTASVSFPSKDLAESSIDIQRLLPPPHPRSMIFVVRHAESRWNQAQANRNVRGLMHYDHPLSDVGVAQADALYSVWKCESIAAEESSTSERVKVVHSFAQRAEDELGVTAGDIVEVLNTSPPAGEDWVLGRLGGKEGLLPRNHLQFEERLGGHADAVKMFMDAQTIYCSPLTRAVQTALLGLRGHRAYQRGGMVLDPVLRELKKIGGMDTVGKVVGEDVLSRALETLEIEHRSDEMEAAAANADTSSCASQWWTGATKWDAHSDSAMEARFLEMLSTVRYRDPAAQSAVVVGHSLYLREFIQRFLSPDFVSQDPDFARTVTSQKIPNACCLGLEVDWTARRPQIVGVIPMFGMTFPPPHH